MGILSKKVGRRIKEIRESLNIKQFELAEMLDMEPTNMTRIENGYQFPKEENLTKIAENLGVKEKDLFEFGHFKTKEELISAITATLSGFDKKQVECCYKIIKSIKELK